MKVVLLTDVKGVGKKGELIEVSEGYGRNFLLPKKFAQEATAENLNVAKAKAGSAARKKAQDNDEAKLMAAQLAKLTVKIPVKVGANGRLFGSVTGKDVSDVLKKQHNIDMDKRKIALKSEITGTSLEDVYNNVIKATQLFIEENEKDESNTSAGC